MRELLLKMLFIVFKVDLSSYVNVYYLKYGIGTFCTVTGNYREKFLSGTFFSIGTYL
jgi:hypothetical protein